MDNRTMSNRDHLEALIAAARNLSSDPKVASTPAVMRLLATASRAAWDVYPEG